MPNIPTGLDNEDNSTISCFVDDDRNERVTFMNISKYFAYRAEGIAPTQAHILVYQAMRDYLESAAQA